MELTSLYFQQLSARHDLLNKEAQDELPNPEYSFKTYKNGYTLLHQALDRYYCNLLTPSEKSSLESFSLNQQGFIHSSSSAVKDLSNEWNSLVESRGSKRSIQDELITSPDLLNKFCGDWVSWANSPELVNQTGSKLLIYNGFTDVLVPTEDRLSVSGKWHYDNYTPGSYVRIIIFLNDYSEHGGIDLYDKHWSQSFSDQTGYVGLPLGERLSDIESLCNDYDLAGTPYEVRPQAGTSSVLAPVGAFIVG